MTLNKCRYILLIQCLAIAMIRAETKGIKVLKYPNNILIYKPLETITNETNKILEKTTSFTDETNGFTIFIDDPNIDSTDPETTKQQQPNNYNTPNPMTDKQCQVSITSSACQSFCSGDLIFEDNFDSMNWTTWHHEQRIAKDVGDGEFVCFQNHAENCYISNGQLHIVPTFLFDSPQFGGGRIKFGSMDLAENCTGSVPAECKIEDAMLPPILSASIRTKNSFQFRYGRVEVRAKLPKGDWLFPIIQLDPADNAYTLRNHSSGRLRIAFARGNIALIDSQGNDISGIRLVGGAILSNLRDIRLYSTVGTEHLGNAFHNYTLTWTNEYIALAMDGKEYARFSGGFHNLQKTHNIPHAQLWKEGGYMAPFDRDFYITLGVGVGGQTDFPNESWNPINSFAKPWENTDPRAVSQFWKTRYMWQNTWKGADVGLHVDYVRIYAI